MYEQYPSTSISATFSTTIDFTQPSNAPVVPQSEIKEPITNRRSRRQGGFIMGLDTTASIAVIAALLAIIIPVTINLTESGDATAIATGYSSIQKAAQEAYPSGVYTPVSWANITNFLPEGYSQVAANGATWSVAVAGGNSHEMVISLPITDTRLRAKVQAKLNSGNVALSGSNLTLTTR
jgi:hypothetical protein